MPAIGAGSRKNPFKFQAGHNIGMFFITKSVVDSGIIRLGTGSDDDRPDFEFNNFICLHMVNGINPAKLGTDFTAAGFEMHAQDKTNRRLNMLTILSAIFMPITLLSGIWGMNFEFMPELKYTFAYFLALGFMSLVGWAMYFLFRRKGYFD